MTPLRYAGIIVGSLLWGLLVFWGSFPFAFPKNTAKAYLQWQVQELSGGEMALDVTQVSPWRLTGLQADDVVVYSVDRRAKRGEPGATPLAKLDDLAVRLELLRLLGGATIADYQATLYGGEVSGVAGTAGSRLELVVDGEGVDLARIPIEGDGWGIDLQGLLELDIELEADTESIDNSQGHARLKVDGLVLAGGNAMGSNLGDLGDGIVPATFSDAVLSLKIDDGVAKVKKGQFISDAVEMEVDGDIQLRKTLSRSKLNLTVTIKLVEALDRLAKLAPVMSKARDEEGTYHLLIGGTVSRPSPRQDASKVRSSRSPSRTTPSSRSRATPTRVKDKDQDKGKDNDDRASARRERMEKLRAKRDQEEADRPDRLPPEDLMDDEDFGLEDEMLMDEIGDLMQEEELGYIED